MRCVGGRCTLSRSSVGVETLADARVGTSRGVEMLPTWRWSLLALLVSWWSSVLASEVYSLEYDELAATFMPRR